MIPWLSRKRKAKTPGNIEASLALETAKIETQKAEENTDAVQEIVNELKYQRQINHIAERVRLSITGQEAS